MAPLVPPRPASRILGLALAFAALAAPARSQQLVRVRVDSPEARELAREWLRAGVDVLEGTVGDASFEIVLAEEDLGQLRRAARGASVEIVERGRPFAEIQRERAAQATSLAGTVPPGYLDRAQILASMQATAAAHPTICEVVDVTAAFGGDLSWNGRSIAAVKISDAVDLDEDEPAVLIVADYHGREIVTPVIALHAIERLTTLYATDPAVRAAVDAHEIWIVPIANPDGYEHVFQVDNLWRKNRRPNGGSSFGVDLNRNHAFGWTAPCAGSSNPGSETYRGPAADSEPEVRTILALTAARRFAKVLDYHSSGREVLYAYSCLQHPWAGAFLAAEAAALATASGYSTIRAPSAEGEHFEWQLFRGAHAFLIETHVQFQPTYPSAQSEAAQVWSGIRWMLARPISLSGHVTDACSGEPLEASVELVGVAFSHGEGWSSGGPSGRFDVIAPAGNHQVRFSAPGHVAQTHPVTLSGSAGTTLDVALEPLQAWSSYCTAGTTANGCAATLSAIGKPSASAATSFVVSASSVEGAKTGLFFYGTSGASASPWALGSTSFLCVAPPRQRTPAQGSGGSAGACDGVLALDWNAFVASHPNALGVPFSAGDELWIQAWFRDPPSPAATSLSDALEASVCP
jgi:carboxypeptidase T